MEWALGGKEVRSLEPQIPCRQWVCEARGQERPGLEMAVWEL